MLHAIPDGPPARFIWRRQTHRVVRSGGPERIAPEWWREKSIVRLRDYYNVEDSDGRRYWIYREGVAGAGEQILQHPQRHAPDHPSVADFDAGEAFVGSGRVVIVDVVSRVGQFCHRHPERVGHFVVQRQCGACAV